MTDDWKHQSSEHDEEVAKAASEICKLLEIDWIDPRKIQWAREVPPDECMMSGGIGRRALLLPARLRGSLDPSELRPIIASSLFYMKFQRQFYRGRRGLFLMLLSLSAFALGLPTLLLLLASQAASVRILLALGYVIPMLLIVMRLFAAGERRMRLTADRQAAGLVGQEALLHSLAKIGNAGLLPRKMGRRSTRNFAFKPSIAERIESLKVSN